MEQERRELTLSLELPDQTNVKCPRCESTNTRFRYYNNNRLSQPRYKCKNCKRTWTVGGKLRDIPIGGGSYNRPYRQLAPLPLDDQLENTNSQPQMAEMVPQNSGPTGILLGSGNVSADMSFMLDWDTKPMAPPQVVMGQPVNMGNQFAGGADDMADWDTKPMAPPQVVMGHPVNMGNQFAGGADDMVFHIKLEPMVTNQSLPQGYIGQANNYASSYQGPDYNLVQPTFDMNLSPQNSINDFFLTTPNGWMNRNSGGNTTDAGMPSTSANPNRWTKFPGYGSE